MLARAKKFKSAVAYVLKNIRVECHWLALLLFFWRPIPGRKTRYRGLSLRRKTVSSIHIISPSPPPPRMQGTTDQRSATKLCPSCCSASLTLSFGFCVCVWVWAFNFDFQLDFFWLATFWAAFFCGVGMGQEHALPQPFPQLPRVHPKCNESAMSGAYAWCTARKPCSCTLV